MRVGSVSDNNEREVPIGTEVRAREGISKWELGSWKLCGIPLEVQCNSKSMTVTWSRFGSSIIHRIIIIHRSNELIAFCWGPPTYWFDWTRSPPRWLSFSHTLPIWGEREEIITDEIMGEAFSMFSARFCIFRKPKPNVITKCRRNSTNSSRTFCRSFKGYRSSALIIKLLHFTFRTCSSAGFVPRWRQ